MNSSTLIIHSISLRNIQLIEYCSTYCNTSKMHNNDEVLSIQTRWLILMNNFETFLMYNNSLTKIQL